MLGVAPIDFDTNSSDLIKCGWYVNCSNCTLSSGPPYNYNEEKSEFEMDGDIKMFLDYNERRFGFISYYNEYDLYSDIPTDKPLIPVILLFDENDSIEIDDNEE